MTTQKVLFFDIDGTLTDMMGQIPASTLRALSLCKRAGHRILLCSGRPKSEIHANVLAPGFDGMVASAGAYVELDGRVLHQHCMDVAELSGLLDFFHQNGILYMLQAKEYIETDPQVSEKLIRVLEEQLGLSKERIERIFGKMTLNAKCALDPRIEKLVYYESPYRVRDLAARISPYFQVTGFSYGGEDETKGEITIAGETKASGMQVILDALHLTREETIAFGDGPNDIEMMRYAGISVAMGNGREMIKEMAHLVTGAVNEDGIYRACETLGLF
ncbi:MAG: Cof-type HAD-IIB family hydrolase [Lachnospiraceae bacterium]|nr:Cof-type HAD-IIB family hydrolase [Lachnospiraceae bacterium]